MLVESGPLIGGTTARSGGILWAPMNYLPGSPSPGLGVSHVTRQPIVGLYTCGQIVTASSGPRQGISGRLPADASTRDGFLAADHAAESQG